MECCAMAGPNNQPHLLLEQWQQWRWRGPLPQLLFSHHLRAQEQPLQISQEPQSGVPPRWMFTDSQTSTFHILRP